MTAAAALQALLDGEHAAYRDAVREGLADPAFALPLRLPTGEYREQVLQWLRALAEGGRTAVGFPERYGGEGNVAASIAAFETLGHGDLSLLVKAGVQFGLFGGAVLHLGTERHHAAYLADIATARLPGCFAMTETGHGSNVQAVRTTATHDPDADEIVVHTPDLAARKDWIGNAACHGRMAAVFAQLVVGGERRGVHCVLVPLRGDDGEPLPGVTIEDCGEKLGLNGVDNGRIRFDQVRVPRDNLLDRYAQIRDDGTYLSAIENPDRRFFTMVGTLIQGRVSVGGAAISATKSALTIAIRHGLTRRQFGPPDTGEEVLLLDYRVHQRRLLPRLATVYALHFAQEELVRDVDRVFTGDVPEDERRRIETRAAGLKVLATRHCTDTIQECREACGGAGYLAANRFAALKADTDVFTTFEGDNTVLLQLVAKNLLTGHRDEIGELDPLGMAAFFASQAVEIVAERSALRELLGRLADDLVPGRDDEGDLMDRDWQLGLLRWREQHVLAGAARRLRGGIDAGRDPFDVLNDAQDHVVAVARAHVDALVAGAFARAVARCEDAEVRGALDRLCHLHCLWTIENERAWFQEHGRISSTRSKAVTKAVNVLCGEVREDAALLVDAFAIPDQVLAEEIG